MSPPHGPTIIIKKKKVVAAPGHHGGAWKVAYADFVTAMMAFFLLMWLLNATTEDQRKGLADYFNPSIPISRISGGGSGALNGSSVLSERTLTQDGVGASAHYTAPSLRDDGSDESAEDVGPELRSVEKEINKAEDKLATRELADHISTRMTPDGLIVELADQDESPLFEIGSARPSPLLTKLLEAIAPVLATVENDIEVIGHTDARPFSGEEGYTNWNLSADRANISRTLLIEHGLPKEQFAAVVGKADTDPLSVDPYAARNRRIAILLVSRQAKEAGD
ncbi:MAG: flagellar motor protein MotB [Parvularculaceae bacterium]|nr:flagellar motor protein MotB [Parvularculaceae bacterium]